MKTWISLGSFSMESPSVKRRWSSLWESPLMGRKSLWASLRAATENEVVCRHLIQDLVDRGLQYQQGLLAIIDGSKGLFNAVTRSLKGYVCVQRCQWHKRRNVTSYLAKGQQARIKRKMQKAYEKPTYNEAKADLLSLKPELALVNQSAVKSLEEGIEETSSQDSTAPADTSIFLCSVLH